VLSGFILEILSLLFLGKGMDPCILAAIDVHLIRMDGRVDTLDGCSVEVH
jgi:hypothetical protein